MDESQRQMYTPPVPVNTPSRRRAGRGRPARSISVAVDNAIAPLRRRLQDFYDEQTRLENSYHDLETINEVSPRSVSLRMAWD
jgi:hypothetical protein